MIARAETPERQGDAEGRDPQPGKGRAERTADIVTRVVDRDGAVEIVLRHQHRRDDEPRRRRKRAATAEKERGRQQHGRRRPVQCDHGCEDDRYRGHRNLSPDQHAARVDDVGQRAGGQGQKKHRQRGGDLDRRHHHRIWIKAGHEPVRRGVEHRESDVGRGTRDEHDRERQIAENAPAPVTRLQARPTSRWTRWTTRSPLEKSNGQYLPDSQIKWRTAKKVSRRRSAKDAFTRW